ncbi:glycosyltransferase family 2 protein [Pararhizobium sp. DWP3-4]|uniref:glycosyltransferase family 2 protein n=1 Tax=unclassified Pararhizobium TaxID=2643050 RepID=UPI003CF5A66F
MHEKSHSLTIDLCIVLGRRPDLLQRTLESFERDVFPNFVFQNVFVNIDPIFGTEQDERDCMHLVKLCFPSAHFFRPEKPGFCAAVKRLWSHTLSDYVFHLEDDWVALDRLDKQLMEPFHDPHVMQVSFHTADQHWDIARKGHLHQRNEYARVFGVNIPLFRKFPKFTTSPSVLRGDFARQAAGLMDETRDPEKQFYSGVNAPLERLAKPNKNFIFSPQQKPVIRDIGREWRDNCRIKKVVQDATSIWVSE